jgi:hypothetical protein
VIEQRTGARAVDHPRRHERAAYPPAHVSQNHDPHNHDPHNQDGAFGMPAIARRRDEATVQRGARNHRSAVMPSPRHYAVGRGLAHVVSFGGWLGLVVGCVAGFVTLGSSYGFVPLAALGVLIVVLPFAGWAIGAGVALIIFGHVARAAFDTADATRELVEIARGKSESGSHPT